MLSTLILLTSIILQLLAAFFALRLIPVTGRVLGRRMAWVFIAFALLLMAFRRAIILYHILSGDIVHTPDFISELVALIISAMMVVGLAYIAPFFLSVVRADEKLKLFRALIDHSNDAVFIVEPETGHLLDVNDTACETLGYERKELLGMAVTDVETIFQTEGAWREHLERVGKYGTIVFEGRHRRRDGGTFPVERSIKFLRHHGREYIVAMVRDITKRKTAERMHRDQYNFLQILIDTIPSPIFYKDVGGYYRGCNKTFEDVMGVTKEEIEGKSVYDLAPKELADKYFEMDKELFDNPGTQLYESSVKYADGTTRDVIFNKATYTNMAGELSGLVGVITDITERKDMEGRLRRSEDLFRRLVESINVVVWELDLSTLDFSYVSPQAEKITGYTPEEWVNFDSWVAMVHPDDRQAAIDFCMHETKEGRDHEFEYRLITKGGDTIWIRDIVTLAYDGNTPTMLRGFLVDITAHKMVDMQLNIAKDDAEAASRAKSSFLATISHEVRTPLTVIIGVADLLAETNLDKEQRKFIGILHESGDALLAQINDILDFSRVEADKVILHEAPFNLTELFDVVCEAAKVKGKAKAIEVNCIVAEDVPAMVIGAGDRLRQVLFNLVTNAVKFSNDRGDITIDVKLSENVSSDGNDIVLLVAVKDSGIGIPPERLKAIFDPFTQADDSVAREHGGSGLGLAISKRLAELMDGHLHAESVVDEGSTFYLTVRLGIYKTLGDESARGKDASSEQRVEEAVSDDTSPLKILLAEDSEHIRFVVKTYLKDMPYELDMAENGKEAFEMYSSNRYDIVLMDIQMPIVDGYKATGNIRAYEEANGRARVPIVALTAHAFREQETKSMAAGCTAHLVKPVSKKDLLKVIADSTAAMGTAMVSHEGAEYVVPLIFKERIPAFLEELGRDIEAMEGAVKRANYATILNIGHAIKGDAASYGLGKVSEFGATLETAAEGKDSKAVRKALKEFLRHLKRIKVEYEKD